MGLGIWTENNAIFCPVGPSGSDHRRSSQALRWRFQNPLQIEKNERAEDMVLVLAQVCNDLSCSYGACGAQVINLLNAAILLSN